MEEAKYSLNIKFRWQGFECQYTARSDENGGQALMKGKQIIETLLAQGAVPNGNGKPAVPPSSERLCPVCHQADQLELVKFQKDGKPRQAYKCQRCNKWLPDEK